MTRIPLLVAAALLALAPSAFAQPADPIDGHPSRWVSAEVAGKPPARVRLIEDHGTPSFPVRQVCDFLGGKVDTAKTWAELAKWLPGMHLPTPGRDIGVTVRIRLRGVTVILERGLTTGLRLQGTDLSQVVFGTVAPPPNPSPLDFAVPWVFGGVFYAPLGPVMDALGVHTEFAGDKLHLPPQPQTATPADTNEVGPRDAKVFVRAFYPGNHQCRPVKALIFSLAAKYPGKVRARFVPFDTDEGFKEWQDAGLSCGGVLVNDKQTFEARQADGSTREVIFKQRMGDLWTPEDLTAAVADAVSKAYGAQTP